MLHLDPTHLIVKEAIINRFKADRDQTVDVRVADFDDTRYLVLVTPEDKNTMKISAAISNSSKIIEAHRDVLVDKYGKYLADKPEPTFDITLVVNLNEVPESDEEREKLATSLAQIKRNVISAPLVARCRALMAGNPTTEPFHFAHRPGEAVYFIPRNDRVIVTYDVSFKEPTDLCIAKIFLQEFNEVKRISSLASAPQPSFLPPTVVPQEIRDSPALNSTVKDSPYRVGFISFALLDRHCKPEVLDNTVDRIMQFRAYLHYHIKCSKSHMHTRMRKRVESMLQVLNRAVPDLPKEKRTISGRTFKISTGGAVGL